MNTLDQCVKIVNEANQKLRKKLEEEYYETPIDCQAFLKKHKQNLRLAEAVVLLR